SLAFPRRKRCTLIFLPFPRFLIRWRIHRNSSWQLAVGNRQSSRQCAVSKKNLFYHSRLTIHHSLFTIHYSPITNQQSRLTCLTNELITVVGSKQWAASKRICFTIQD